MNDVPSDVIDGLRAPADLGEVPRRPTRVRYRVLGFLAAMTFVLLSRPRLHRPDAAA